MEIDSLVISLGLDPSKLQAALEQVQAAIQQGQVDIADFVQGIQEGFQEALQEVAEGSAQAGGAVAQAGEAAEEAGQKFREAGSRGAQGMQELGDKAQQAAAKAKAAGGEVQALGRRVGGFIRGIITTVAAPLAGALSAGAIIGSYMGDVAQVAQMTGRYSTQMEEWRKKRELLSRINREDVELYRKGKLALLDFNFAMSGLSTTIMRALSPAIRFGIDLLTSLADWIRRNEPNIIRFFAVLAGTVTATLVPAFAKLGKAMLMNPLTWIIAGILLLAIVIDDLVTYIQGGESALDGLWSQFGTGEEILEKLRYVWEALLYGFSRLTPLLPMLLSLGTVWATWRGGIAILGRITSAINGVKSAFTALKVVMATNPFGAFLLIASIVIVYWDEIVAGAKKVIAVIKDVIGSLVNGIKRIVNGIPDFLLPDGVKKWASSVEKAGEFVPTGVADPLGLGAGVIPTNGELTRAAVPPSATVNQTRTVNSETSIGQLNVYSQAQDADGILRDARGAADKRLYGFGAFSAEGGVRP